MNHVGLYIFLLTIPADSQCKAVSKIYVYCELLFHLFNHVKAVLWSSLKKWGLDFDWTYSFRNQWCSNSYISWKLYLKLNLWFNPTFRNQTYMCIIISFQTCIVCSFFSHERAVYLLFCLNWNLWLWVVTWPCTWY